MYFNILSTLFKQTSPLYMIYNLKCCLMCMNLCMIFITHNSQYNEIIGPRTMTVVMVMVQERTNISSSLYIIYNFSAYGHVNNTTFVSGVKTEGSGTHAITHLNSHVACEPVSVPVPGGERTESHASHSRSGCLSKV